MTLDKRSQIAYNIHTLDGLATVDTNSARTEKTKCTLGMKLKEHI